MNDKDSRQRTLIAIAVVEHAGRFLVGQRPSGVPLAGYWEFPGGKVEPHETVVEAAVRECLEETGVLVEVQGVYPSQIQDYSHGQVELHFFNCRVVGEAPPPRESYRWVSRADLPSLSFPEGNRRLLELLR